MSTTDPGPRWLPTSEAPPQPRTAERCTCAELEHHHWSSAFHDGLMVGIALATLAVLAVLAINRGIG